MANYVDGRHADAGIVRGAEPTEREENQRALLADNGTGANIDTPEGVGTGEAYATENTENARALTVPYAGEHGGTDSDPATAS